MVTETIKTYRKTFIALATVAAATVGVWAVWQFGLFAAENQEPPYDFEAVDDGHCLPTAKYPDQECAHYAEDDCTNWISDPECKWEDTIGEQEHANASKIVEVLKANRENQNSSQTKQRGVVLTAAAAGGLVSYFTLPQDEGTSNKREPPTRRRIPPNTANAGGQGDKPVANTDGGGNKPTANTGTAPAAANQDAQAPAGADASAASNSKTGEKNTFPWWGWILILVAVAAVVGAVIYFFCFTGESADEDLEAAAYDRHQRVRHRRFR